MVKVVKHQSESEIGFNYHFKASAFHKNVFRHKKPTLPLLNFALGLKH
jgi:hypothetical protein